MVEGKSVRPFHEGGETNIYGDNIISRGVRWCGLVLWGAWKVVGVGGVEEVCGVGGGGTGPAVGGGGGGGVFVEGSGVLAPGQQAGR